MIILSLQSFKLPMQEETVFEAWVIDDYEQHTKENGILDNMMPLQVFQMNEAESL